MFYKVDPKYSLVLKKNCELLIISDKNTKKIKVDYDEISKMDNILCKAFFLYEETSIFKLLLRKKIIVKAKDSSKYHNTYSYLETYTNKVLNMKDLENKCVVIIGLGGIGVELLNHLLGSGIKKFILIDYDKVEVSNLNRQYIYNEQDINKNKVDVAKEKAVAKKTDCIIYTYNKYIESSEDIDEIISKHNPDIIVCAADTPYLDIRISILETCLKHFKPCIFGGVGIEKGQYGPTLTTKKSMRNYLIQLKNIKEKIIGSNINKASFGPTNSIIAAYMAIDIIMALINSKKNIASLNSIHEINFKKGNNYEVKKF